MAGGSRKIRRQGWPSSVALSRVGRYMSSPAIDFRQEATRPRAPTPFLWSLSAKIFRFHSYVVFSLAETPI